MKQKIKIPYIASLKCNIMLRAMKISTLFLFLCSFTVVADNVYSQQKEISLNLKNTTLKEAISQIEKSSDYVFLVSDEVRHDLNKVVSGNFNKESISQIMNYLLKKYQSDL